MPVLIRLASRQTSLSESQSKEDLSELEHESSPELFASPPVSGAENLSRLPLPCRMRSAKERGCRLVPPEVAEGSLSIPFAMEAELFEEPAFCLLGPVRSYSSLSACVHSGWVTCHQSDHTEISEGGGGRQEGRESIAVGTVAASNDHGGGNSSRGTVPRYILGVGWIAGDHRGSCTDDAARGRGWRFISGNHMGVGSLKVGSCMGKVAVVDGTIGFIP
eukprot:765117-Hanusia_phi.AAC.1